MITDNSLDISTIIGLYEKVQKIRMVEETIAERYSDWGMRCPTHLCTGQEAAAAGVCQALRKDDFAVSTHRAHGHYIAKGGNINKLIAEIYGKASGCSGGKGGSMHLVDLESGFMGSTAIVGGTIPIGVGLGLSVFVSGTDQVSVVFFGDAAVEEGVFYESVNFAVLKKLPVLFICENNLYSVYSPLKVRQPEERKIYRMVEAMGIRSGHGDGNDAIEVYDMAAEAVQTIRQGGGPVFLELSTYRWREHCGHLYDNDLGYRSVEEFSRWKERDPVPRLEKYLRERNILNDQGITLLNEKVRSEVAEAFEFAEASPFPDSSEMYTEIFSQ